MVPGLPASRRASFLVAGFAAALAALALAGPAAAAPGLEAPHLLQDRDPIRIDRDADFDAAHGVRGGNGSAEDPFVIAHWRINASNAVHVRIANVTKAFVVRNNELSGQCLDPSNNSCVFEAGIHVTNLTGGSLVHNRIAGMDRAGISVELAEAVEVVENLVEGGGAGTQGAGILVSRSSGVEVRGNHVLDVGPREGAVVSAAVRVRDSGGTLVQGNEVRGAREFALSLLTSTGTRVLGNVVADNRNGIAAQGRDAVLLGNNVTGNTLYGLLATGGALHVEGGHVAGNARGIEVQAPGNATLRQLRVEGNREAGLRLVGNATVDARETWWGAASGPDVNGGGPGTGDRVTVPANTTRLLLYTPFLTEPPQPSGEPSEGGRVVVGSPPPPPPAPGAPRDPAPVAVFEGPTRAFVTREVEYTAARSYDPDGATLRYAWDLGDNATATGPRVKHTYNATGTYVLALRVTDPDGFSASASAAIAVLREPLGVQIAVNGSAVRGENLTVTAFATGQPTGPVLYRFTTGGPGSFTGAPSALSTAAVRLDEPREYSVGVEATAGNETATAFERVLVVNRPPLARLAVEPAQGDTATEFRFSAAGSTDPDGDALAYTWDLGAGQQAQGPDARRRFASPGTHLVVVSVSDGFSASTAQVALEVRPASATPGDRGAPGPGPLGLAAAAVGAAFLARRREGR